MKKKHKKVKQLEEQEDIIAEINKLRTPLIDEWEELRKKYKRSGLLSYAQRSEMILERIANSTQDCQNFFAIQALSKKALGEKEN